MMKLQAKRKMSEVRKMMNSQEKWKMSELKEDDESTYEEEDDSAS
jgi:hypothetical protein